MNTLKKQAGMSMLGWLVIILMVGVLGSAAIKLAPAYFEYYSIVGILDNMQQDPSLRDANMRDIEVTFAKRMGISQIRLEKDDYKITRAKGKKNYQIEIDYEVRKSLFGNLEILAKFKRTAEIGG